MNQLFASLFCHEWVLNKPLIQEIVGVLQYNPLLPILDIIFFRSSIFDNHHIASITFGTITSINLQLVMIFHIQVFE
jgi:hypothetical protein